jgi:hypothetical protein
MDWVEFEKGANNVATRDPSRRKRVRPPRAAQKWPARRWALGHSLGHSLGPSPVDASLGRAHLEQSVTRS